ncbi:MAG: PD-(D/E)XK nuclease family protein [Spirochaetales bacterium]|nr:PD-(D/E)XK nuclease family protein [Spirochaetales bacterium]
MEQRSRFIRELQRLCNTDLLTEKWLIAPTHRIGFQWIDQVSAAGQPVLNLRLKTIRTIAMDFASGALASKELVCISGLRKELLVGAVFEGLRKQKSGYLNRLSSGKGLLKRLCLSIEELRLAGLESGDINPDFFEVPEKGKEIIRLLRDYEKALASRRLADYTDVLKLAMHHVMEMDTKAEDGPLLVVPEAAIRFDFHPLEKQFWSKIPGRARKVLSCDNPNDAMPEERTDITLLSKIRDVTGCPPPRGDDSANIFHASGAVNEIREVFRRIVSRKIPFDKVEVIQTDSATYVPIIYESAFIFGEGTETDIPVTFEEGIPIHYSKPGRALYAWIRWFEEGFPQYRLTRMIREGLLNISSGHASLFQTIHIWLGRERYLPLLDRAIAAYKKPHASMAGRHFDDDISPPVDIISAGRKQEMLKKLHSFVQDLLSHTPQENSDESHILSCAIWFVKHASSATNEFDNYAKQVMLRGLEEIGECVESGETLSGFDLRSWLSRLSQDLSAMALGPRPSHVYVTSIASGGHSGRPYTFIVGLDDTRFPGSGTSDPILLDHERKRISGELDVKGDLPENKMRELSLLFSRLRGNCTLSFSSLDMIDNRQIFPSPVILSAYRILSGNHEADHGCLMNALHGSVSFTPGEPDACITGSEFWAHRLCGSVEVENRYELTGKFFPHLGRGFDMRRARESDSFTVFDGFVPSCTEDIDPYSEGGIILSSSGLELLARCPLHFFFRYVLGIEEQEDETIDTARWLTSLDRGSLLHEVFREFMEEVSRRDQRPLFNEHRTLLHTILDRYIDIAKIDNPPCNPLVMASDISYLRKTADVFLRREEKFCRTSRPVFFEVTIGVRQTGNSTLLDSEDPLTLRLTHDKSVRVRARIDRIDRADASGDPVFSVWDYKTGRSAQYGWQDPFTKGRIIQNILYLAASELRLKQHFGPRARVGRFGFFFPSIGELGRRIWWDRDTLTGGTRYLLMLCDMIAAGCFPYTDTQADIAFSGYTDAVVDGDRAIEEINRKISVDDNENLQPFKRFRNA